MIIFLHGPDSYRRQRKLDTIVEEYKQKHSGMSLGRFDLENEGEFEKFRDFSGQMLIFDNKKLAVLKNISAVDGKKLKEILKNNLNSEVLTILISEDSAAGFETLLKKAFLSEKFEEFSGEKMKFVIQKEAKAVNVSLSADATDFLAEKFKKDSWGLMNELNKLFLWKGDGAKIDLADVKKAGDYSGEQPNIFNFINSIARNYSFKQKISDLEKLLIAGEEPAKVFNIMASLRYLPKSLVKKMADCDVAVKSGKLDYEEVFLDLALWSG